MKSGTERQSLWVDKHGIREADASSSARQNNNRALWETLRKEVFSLFSFNIKIETFGLKVS